MNKLVIAIALCAALAACKREATAPAADAMAPAADPASAPAATPAPPADAAAPAVVAGNGLPKACKDYLNRAKACFAKSNPAMAAAFQQSIDQARSQWEAAADKTALAPACTQANEQFSQTVAALKCE